MGGLVLMIVGIHSVPNRIVSRVPAAIFSGRAVGAWRQGCEFKVGAFDYFPLGQIVPRICGDDWTCWSRGM